MYETEANRRTAPGHEIPKDIEEQFGGLGGQVLARTVLPWSEHCTECVWPTCYTTCDLYSPREDGRCRRFAEGMVRIECPSAFNQYLLKIQFKQWAKLWSPANVRLYPAHRASKIEQSDRRIGNLLQILPVPAPLKAFAAKKRYGLKKRRANQHSACGELPTSLLLECYNPAAHEVGLSLTLRPVGQRVNFPFQRLFSLTPGFQRIRVSINDITRLIDLEKPFEIELIPNNVENLTTLYFGVMDFVRERVEKPVEVKPAKSSKAKCVVWDLDNTLWDGILVEDGSEEITLKPGIVEVIKALDERGILQSVASKNNHDEAMQALNQFGLGEYFLYPQISWQPKSEGVGAIAKQLNIGIDTILFVDDSRFERDQVTAVHPRLRALDAVEYLSLLDREECRGAVTAESKERRKMYQIEAQREVAVKGFGSDYLAFLRDAKIVVSIGPMMEENLERVHELTQRTNQMNFSGNRYDREVLRSIAANPHLDTYVLSCEDRFGSYGIVGFSIVDAREPRLTDLMFSCRVQSKRVEHAFLTYLLFKYVRGAKDGLFVSYRRTPRNAASGKVFEDFGMEELETVNGVTSLVFRGSRKIPDDEVIRVAETLVGAK
jgi:FkbH-like protein